MMFCGSKIKLQHVKKDAAEAAGGIIIGSMGGPWVALGGGVTGAALCYLND